MLRVAPRKLGLILQLHWKDAVGKGTGLRT